ncbi:hypothetical protein SODALDRAFT_276984 [Sodiomyces alkalinus F11]|uniref:Zn(2)-C6 fungal-type domain-containing protein n=1 Tax=Sodiomyces alkalinus (strain CBS 110278 / VKM F-3762 / F11) TaxID=1314773 RepID=A0A3N2PVW7_SODAK|nr:hypothetical protein SODALDRAFT_276984 [Sodiomyces alkalinus F11]ROT38628.1 hypothetical protein SODALDRAFT_276984 [Sodiomyces alkalinus F11]
MDITEGAPETLLPHPQTQSNPAGEVSKEDPDRKKSVARKRTKTGCLTCRKRRIKCDESKPICNNCTKSKRHCEGYNQRVIFKDPIGAFHAGNNGPVPYLPESSQHAFPQLGNSQPNPSSQAPPLAAIAPKPRTGPDYPGYPRTVFVEPLAAQSSSSSSTSYAFPQPPSSSSPYRQPPPSVSSSLTPPLQPHHPYSDHGVEQAYLPTPGPDDVGLKLSGGHMSTSPNSYFSARDMAGAAPITQHHTSGRSDLPPKAEMTHPYLDDDGSMANSDDDLGLGDVKKEDGHGGLVQRRINGPVEGFGTEMRTFSAFADDSVLTSYVPTATNSPLNDDRTAALFWHFVNVTGPSMSLYERHPFDHTNASLDTQSAPQANHNIWTYTFPIISFQHPALLQAILAMGSLQIARLQYLPPTAAMKHYHLAIRRIAHNVRSPTKRTQPANLAATLVLAYFEVWNSDHTKWCQHLLGARVLFREIPFREMTRHILPLKRAKRALFEGSRQPHDPLSMGYGPSPRLKHDLDDVDTEFLGQLAGRHVEYDDQPPSPGLYYTARDIEHYEYLRDLFWWYCKMDVYHSLLSGDRPFMEFKNWTQCPPRAPMGRLEAIYGTYDHVMLVLGRLMAFAAKDLSRKRKAMQSFGMGGPPFGPPRGSPTGPTGPPAGGPPGTMPPGMPPGPMMGMPPGGMPPGGMPPGMMMGMPPGGFPPGMFGGPGGGSPPMFPGMLPTSSKVSLPTGFSPMRDQTPPRDISEDVDLGTATEAALLEWESIREAFAHLRSRFGPELEPLGAEYADRRDSPFGPTLQYRTFSVAGIWLNYYLGLIHLYRTHPMMPPAAMVAQGIQARHTEQYAREIGRIAAGLCDDLTSVTEISTLVGAALVESSLPLFVGGIQAQEAAQRHWLIRRLHDTARLTGWQSARQIAEGCESAWHKAAELGKGPPYTRDPSLSREIPKSVWDFPRKMASQSEQLREETNGEMVLLPSHRAFYAIGLISVEQELDKLELNDGG